MGVFRDQHHDMLRSLEKRWYVLTKFMIAVVDWKLEELAIVSCCSVVTNFLNFECFRPAYCIVKIGKFAVHFIKDGFDFLGRERQRNLSSLFSEFHHSLGPCQWGYVSCNKNEHYSYNIVYL